MEIWAVVFLAVLALSSAAQTAMLVVLARGGQRLGRRVDEIQRQINNDIRPSIESINRLTRNAEEVSDRAVLQARRVDRVVHDTLDRLDDLSQALRRIAGRPLGPLSEVVALFKGIRRGIEAYQRLQGFERRRTAPTRRRRSSAREDDEHLFI